jgi:hypothetical protein
MVDVFVHKNRPLMWSELPKERMWVSRAASFAHGDKSIDSFDELIAFALEFALCGVRRKEFRRMGLSLPKTNGLMSRPMTLPGKDARLGLITPT